MTQTSRITVGVLALQGAFHEHILLLQRAATRFPARFELIQVRNREELSRCDALIIPGGESTTLSLVAARSGMLEPLRQFVKVDRRPTWGTCAGMIMLAEAANATKKGGQELIGGLDVRVHRNHFGRQIESFEADLQLPFLDSSAEDEGILSTSDTDGLRSSLLPFPGIFIRAPVVEQILPHNAGGAQEGEAKKGDTVVAPSHAPRDVHAAEMASEHVEIMGVLPSRRKQGMMTSSEDTREKAEEDTEGDIVAVRQGNVFGTSFHPELTRDTRIHEWWLRQVMRAQQQRGVVAREMQGTA